MADADALGADGRSRMGGAVSESERRWPYAQLDLIAASAKLRKCDALRAIELDEATEARERAAMRDHAERRLRATQQRADDLADSIAAFDGVAQVEEASGVDTSAWTGCVQALAVMTADPEGFQARFMAAVEREVAELERKKAEGDE